MIEMRTHFAGIAVAALLVVVPALPGHAEDAAPATPAATSTAPPPASVPRPSIVPKSTEPSSPQADAEPAPPPTAAGTTRIATTGTMPIGSRSRSTCRTSTTTASTGAGSPGSPSEHAHNRQGSCGPRVPDAVQRSTGDAKHRPVRCSAEPGPMRRIVWAPDLHSSKPLRGVLLLVGGTSERRPSVSYPIAPPQAWRGAPSLSPSLIRTLGRDSRDHCGAGPVNASRRRLASSALR